MPRHNDTIKPQPYGLKLKSSETHSLSLVGFIRKQRCDGIAAALGLQERVRIAEGVLERACRAFSKGFFIVKYDLGHKPTKSQVFAQKICYIAFNDWDFPIEVISSSALEHLADEALRRFPEECDVRFRQRAIGRVRVFQRACGRQSGAAGVRYEGD